MAIKKELSILFYIWRKNTSSNKKNVNLLTNYATELSSAGDNNFRAIWLGKIVLKL